MRKKKRIEAKKENREAHISEMRSGAGLLDVGVEPEPPKLQPCRVMHVALRGRASKGKSAEKLTALEPLVQPVSAGTNFRNLRAFTIGTP